MWTQMVVDSLTTCSVLAQAPPTPTVSWTVATATICQWRRPETWGRELSIMPLTETPTAEELSTVSTHCKIVPIPFLIAVRF